MRNKDQLVTQIQALAALGQIEDGRQLNALLGAAQGQSIMRVIPETQMPAAGTASIYNVLDSEGNVLVPGNNYMFRSKKIKVLREEYGQGNIMDTYYRVYYLDGDLEERFICVDGKGGFFSPAVYKSELIAIPEKA